MFDCLYNCCCSVAKSCLTLCDRMKRSMPGFPVLHYLPELPQTHVHWINDAIQPSDPLSPASPPAFSPSQHQSLCQWIDSSYQVAKVLEFQHQSFHRIFRVDFLWDWPLSCQRDSQESSPKSSVLQHSAFFMLQLSHPYMTNRKTIALTRWTFVSKIMSLLFNMLSRFVIAFLPRNKSLLISWLWSPTTVILEPEKIKSVTVSIFSASICHGVMGLDAMIFVILNAEF